MIILGIETSCDETSAAVIEGEGEKIVLKSNVTATSLSIHAKTGGVIPENAAREQIKYILPVIHKALSDAAIQFTDLDAIALTYGPGLIGSLLVGVETAKTIAFVYDLPIIPVNHMIGHIYANWLIADSQLQREKDKPSAISHTPYAEIEFPAIALVVSGGHTDLLLFNNHKSYKLLGGTRDDAAGEAYDKIGRLLGLPYPAGPMMEKAAKRGNPKKFRFPRPLIGSPDYDFSFSGLKTAVLRETQKIKDLDEQTVSDLAFATQDAIVDVLVKKTIKAASKYDAQSVLISGGVAANQSLRDELNVKCQMLNVKFFVPPKNLCTDNAAMIASAGFYNYQPVSWGEVTANPELYFS